MSKMIAVATLLLAMAGSTGTVQAQDLMKRADTNMDGKVSPEEYKVFLVQSWAFFAKGADKLKLSDLDPMFRPAFKGVLVDADGYVTEAAWNTSIEARFKAADQNGDGFLSERELIDSMSAPRD